VEYHRGTEVHFPADRLGVLNLVWVKCALFVFQEVTMKKVGIIMGSDSDLPIIKKATDMLTALEIPFEVHIYSAHRTPVEARDFAVNARANGFGALICAAGMAAHLAGAIAANTTLPVIGIPCKGGMMDGLDALLATVQMPTGIPVATVAVNGGANAALLAAQILAVSDAQIAAKLDAKRIADAQVVLQKDATVMEKL
jgi:5-(carboxyamino)imidazole ribonucleotide mutase